MHPLDPAWQALITQFETAQARAAGDARSRVSEDLNQTARRLKQYKIDSDWYAAVLDGAARFAPEVAIFAIEEGDRFVLKGARGLVLPASLVVPAAQAAAFRNALDSGELAVALATASEVSEPVASSVPVNRALLLPISNGARVAVLLYCAARDGTDANALELIANMASSVLERHSRGPAHLQIASAPPAAPESEEKAAAPGERAALESIPEPDRLQHVRAQRLARVKVAEMQLYRPEACEAGRGQKNIYLFLKREIDSARDIFRAQFLTTKSMADYLHLELLARLAQNDNALLGADYPGQMV
jgi:hypothetical protein